mgnify:CR=1 FL=1|jgi:hemerythrin
MTSVIAAALLSEHAHTMRKTSDILWQDVQHQVLFDILDLISEPGADTDVVFRLQQYTDNHFELEERYMEEFGYPGFADHKRAHDQFRSEIESLLRPGVEFDEELGNLVSTFLRAWLKRHVFGSDKDLEAFILASSRK